MNPITKTFQFGDQTVSIETGKVAKQATGSVVVTIGDTVVLTTVVGAKSARPGQDFFPLTVNYQEKTYAAGKIPGGFFRREGRPSEKETLTCRLIDRPIRPLFPKGFMNEVQVVCTVMSTDKDQDPDIAAMIGTSARMTLLIELGSISIWIFLFIPCDQIQFFDEPMLLTTRQKRHFPCRRCLQSSSFDLTRRSTYFL